jgi:hypothetical protein
MHDLNNFTSNQSYIYIGKSWTWGLAYRREVGLLKMTREMKDRVVNFTLTHRQTILTHKECDILQTRGTRESSVM